MVPIRVLWALKCVIYLLWPATAWATQITLGTTLMAVPALAWLMVFILATVSGLAALLGTLKQGFPSNWLIFVASHMAGSWLAGLLIFFAVEQRDIGDLNEAMAIALGSYAGARLIDRWADLFVKKAAPE